MASNSSPAPADLPDATKRCQEMTSDDANKSSPQAYSLFASSNDLFVNCLASTSTAFNPAEDPRLDSFSPKHTLDMSDRASQLRALRGAINSSKASSSIAPEGATPTADNFGGTSLQQLLDHSIQQGFLQLGLSMHAPDASSSSQQLDGVFQLQQGFLASNDQHATVCGSAAVDIPYQHLDCSTQGYMQLNFGSPARAEPAMSPLGPQPQHLSPMMAMSPLVPQLPHLGSSPGHMQLGYGSPAHAGSSNWAPPLGPQLGSSPGHMQLGYGSPACAGSASSPLGSQSQRLSPMIAMSPLGPQPQHLSYAMHASSMAMHSPQPCQRTWAEAARFSSSAPSSFDAGAAEATRTLFEPGCVPPPPPPPRAVPPPPPPPRARNPFSASSDPGTTGRHDFSVARPLQLLQDGFRGQHRRTSSNLSSAGFSPQGCMACTGLHSPAQCAGSHQHVPVAGVAALLLATSAAVAGSALSGPMPPARHDNMQAPSRREHQAAFSSDTPDDDSQGYSLPLDPFAFSPLAGVKAGIAPPAVPLPEINPSSSSLDGVADIWSKPCPAWHAMSSQQPPVTDGLPAPAEIPAARLTLDGSRLSRSSSGIGSSHSWGSGISRESSFSTVAPPLSRLSSSSASGSVNAPTPLAAANGGPAAPSVQHGGIPLCQLMFMEMHDADCSAYCLGGALEPHKMWFGVGVHRAIRKLVTNNKRRHSLILALHAAGDGNGHGNLVVVYNSVKSMHDGLAAGSGWTTEAGAKLWAGVEELKDLLEQALRNGPGIENYTPPAFLRVSTNLATENC